MITLVLALNVVIILIGLIILIAPQPAFAFLQRYQHTLGLYVAAILGRAAFGVLLIIVAPAAKFPLALQVLGWVVVAAGVSIAIMGRGMFTSSLDGVFKLAVRYGRWAGVLGIVFGGFVVYALQ